MRIIKYRIWQPIDKKFYYWGFIEGGFFAGIPTGAGLTLRDCAEKSQMFINKQDAHGVDIYEGDELMLVNEYSITRTIEYEKGSFFLGDDHLIDVDFKEWEVI